MSQSFASIKDNIIQNLNNIQNLSFNLKKILEKLKMEIVQLLF